MNNRGIVLVSGLVLFLGLIMGAWSAAWSAEVKIGVVDANKVLNGTKVGKKANDSLTEYVNNRKKLVAQDQEDIEKSKEELNKQGAVLSADAKKDKEEAIRRKAILFQQKVNQLDQEIQIKQKEVLDDFLKNLEEAVKNVSEKEKISLVVDKGNSSAGVILVLYSHPSLDITDRVIKEMDKGAK